MAHKGIGFFNNRGQFFKTPADATASDLAALLGRIGEGESLAPGIAYKLLELRNDLDRIFAEHDAMCEGWDAVKLHQVKPADNVAELPKRAG